MKYITSEKMENAIVTMGKARGDIEEIAQKLGYKRAVIPTVFSIRYKKWQKGTQFYLYLKNTKIWDEAFSKMEDGSTVILQINFYNRCLNFYKLLEKHKDRLNFITVIHDLESIRYIGDKSKSDGYMERTKRDEIGILKNSKKVISHNASMTKELIKFGVEEDKIINLEIFDYLSDCKDLAKAHTDGNIIIAGNLDPDKAGYIKNLAKTGVKYNLYGFNYKEEKSDNVSYIGNFKPDELPGVLDGSFGLVWDGESIESCVGNIGRYLKYNNPHKTSLYLSSGLPVIVWKKAAMAPFIEGNKIGFTVDSLNDIKDRLSTIKESEYKEMLKNVSKIRENLRNGKYTTEALKKAEK